MILKLISAMLFTLTILCSVGFAKKTDSNKPSHRHDDHKNHNHKENKATLEKVGNDKLIVKVNGMVCDFCAQGIEKNFNKQKQVRKTEVDLNTMEVTVYLKEGQTLEEKRVKKIVTDAGFSYVGSKQ